MPRFLKLETMVGCNARCVFCPLGAGILKRKPGRMDSEFFYKTVDQARILGLEIEPIFMNEPLMEPRFFEFYDYIESTGGKQTLFTNAALMTESIAEKLCQYQYHPSKFTITFHGGNKEAYEKVMGLNYEKVVSNVKYLISIKPRPNILISMKTTKENINSVDDFKKLWEGYPVKLKISPSINWAGIFYPGEGKSKCPVLHLCGVFWDGRMPLCCTDAEGKIIIGDLKKQSLREILEGEVIQKYLDFNKRNKLSQLYPCSTCDVI